MSHKFVSSKVLQAIVALIALAALWLVAAAPIYQGPMFHLSSASGTAAPVGYPGPPVGTNRIPKVLLFPLALLLGVLAGLAGGGRLPRLANLRLRLPWLVVGALILQAVLALPALAGLPSGVRLAGLAVSYAAGGLWIVLNLRDFRAVPMALTAGLGLAGVGWLLNMVVVLANDGMPVSLAALGRIGAGTGALAGGGPLAKHLQLGGSSVLGVLGDQIPLPALSSVVSIGNIVMLAGLVVAIAAAMRLSPPVAPLPGCTRSPASGAGPSSLSSPI